jgi:hypothetical protein
MLGTNMIEDIVEISVAASADIAIDKAAKNHRSARVIRAILGLLLFTVIFALIFVTFKYS